MKSTVTPEVTPDERILENLKTIVQQGYKIIHFAEKKLENEIYRAIAINSKKLLGSGSFGNIYLAHPVDVSTGALLLDQKLAVKVFKNTSDVRKEEAIFFNAHYGRCEIVMNDDDAYMIMTYLPGKDIMVCKNGTLQLNDQISQFNFILRVDLAYNIMLAINTIHHYKPSTGLAAIHGDINGSNIKVDYADNKINVSIIDFGLSSATEDDPERLQAANMEGTPLFMPNEVVQHDAHGIKSDIYSLTPIFAAIFGATNPFALKSKLRWYDPNYYKTPYDLTGLLDNIEMPSYPGDITSIIKKFLERMGNEDICKRPDSDEALRFFTTLQLLVKTYSEDPKRSEVLTATAKLTVMAEGIWKKSAFFAEAEVVNKNLPAPEDFNFDQDDKLAVSSAIVALAKCRKMDSPLLQRIMSTERGILTRSKACIFSTEDLTALTESLDDPASPETDKTPLRSPNTSV